MIIIQYWPNCDSQCSIYSTEIEYFLWVSSFVEILQLVKIIKVKLNFFSFSIQNLYILYWQVEGFLSTWIVIEVEISLYIQLFLLLWSEMKRQKAEDPLTRREKALEELMAVSEELTSTSERLGKKTRSIWEDKNRSRMHYERMDTEQLNYMTKNLQSVLTYKVFKWNHKVHSLPNNINIIHYNFKTAQLKVHDKAFDLLEKDLKEGKKDFKEV